MERATHDHRLISSSITRCDSGTRGRVSYSQLQEQIIEPEFPPDGLPVLSSCLQRVCSTVSNPTVDD